MPFQFQRQSSSFAGLAAKFITILIQLPGERRAHRAQRSNEMEVVRLRRSSQSLWQTGDRYYKSREDALRFLMLVELASA